MAGKDPAGNYSKSCGPNVCSGSSPCSECQGKGYIGSVCEHGSIESHYSCEHYEVCDFAEHEI